MRVITRLKSFCSHKMFLKMKMNFTRFCPMSWWTLNRFLFNMKPWHIVIGGINFSYVPTIVFCLFSCLFGDHVSNTHTHARTHARTRARTHTHAKRLSLVVHPFVKRVNYERTCRWIRLLPTSNTAIVPDRFSLPPLLQMQPPNQNTLGPYMDNMFVLPLAHWMRTQKRWR